MSGRPPVCKFYKQGNCQYGNNCRFYHPPQTNDYQNNNSFNSYHNFGGNKNNSGSNNYFNKGGNSLSKFSNQTTAQSSHETIQQFCDPSSIGQRETEIRNDMNDLSESLEISNCVFTSYSLKPPASVNVIADRDLSYEEARIQYYLAQSTNSLPQYQQNLASRQNDMKNSVAFLRNNTQKAVRYLQLAAQNPNTTPKPLIPVFDPSVSTSKMQQSGNSIFGSSSSGINSFGGAATASPYNNSSNYNSFSNVSSTTNPSGGTSTLSNANPFGTVSAGSASNCFGVPSIPGGAFATQASPFGSISANTNTAGGAFGSSGFGALANSPANTSAASPFGASPFGALKPTNPFSGAATTSSTAAAKSVLLNSSGFGSSGFGGSSFGSSGFGNSSFGRDAFDTSHNPNSTTQTNLFEAHSTIKTSSNPFQNASNPNAAGGAFGSSNIFQSATQQFPFGEVSENFSIGSSPKRVLGFKQDALDERRTRMEDLGEEVIQIFNAAAFQLGRVPDIPPPLELC